MESLQGHLLISSPKLIDPNFFRSVVLMVQHNAEGALGLVLNQPLETTIQMAWDQISDTPCQVDGFLHQGGPCEGPLMVIHTDMGLSEMEILPGVYFCTEKFAVERLVAENNCKMRFFVGYSGWGAGQLENEMEQGGWLSLPASMEQVFANPDDLWKSLVHVISRSAVASLLDPRFIPDDPSVN